MRQGYPPFFDQIALGLAPGYTAWRKYGANPNIDNSPSTYPEDVWNNGGLYTGQPASTTPVQMGIRSSSGVDDIASSGALTVTIEGLLTSSSSVYTQETVNMSGTSNVLSTNSWYRVNRAFVASAGSTGANVGTISVIGQATGSNAYATITALHGQTEILAYTVPANQSLCINYARVSIVRANGAAGSAEFALNMRLFGTGSWRRTAVEYISTATPTYAQPLVPLVLPAGTDIVAEVASVSDNGTQISGLLNGYLVSANMLATM